MTVELAQTIACLDAWLDTMRNPRGYAGPVTHWWDSSLVYVGTMLDWRYEGIVCGYLNLYRKSDDIRWLQKGVRACSDLVAGQQLDGQFFNSSFERGPKTGGTPHEAAACIALLETAKVLNGDPQAALFFQAAERNLSNQITNLWKGKGFWDQPENPILVANKNATILEALLLYQASSGRDMQEYIQAAAGTILTAQILAGARAGATVHRGTFDFQLSFGIYTARCISAICRLMQVDPQLEYRRFVQKAVIYLLALIRTDGTILGHYRDGRPIAAPIWIAPSGEILRALIDAQAWVDVPGESIQVLTRELTRSQLPSGGIPTGYGISHRGAMRPYSGLPDFRDVLPVVGWCDKVFRALTLLGSCGGAAPLARTELPCTWKGMTCIYLEDEKLIALKEKNGRILYQWFKGNSYPAVMELWV
jgi:hypothetical protein